jgi:DNA-binding NtrC family response regulator
MIVEQGPASLAPTLRRILPIKMGCEIKTWDTLNPESLLHSTSQIILAHAFADGGKPLTFFRWLRESSLSIPVLAVLPETTNQEHLQTISSAVDDLIFIPFREQELKLRLERLLQSHPPVGQQISAALTEQMGLAQLVGHHPAFLRATEEVRLFSASDAPVIISGETGTGKELFARAIHFLSRRSNGPFIPVDCGTLPEHLAENELFGHRRGAFTDAHSDQKGLAGMAEGGTLFLDEIDSLSLFLQSKLLRFLQERSYRALGADRFVQADVRIIAASNRAIEECVRQGQFRSDLYFRLSVLRLSLPALRNRPGDISLLAKYFVESECATRKCRQKALTSAAMRKLEVHHWPGNVRELANTIQRAVLCCSDRRIMPADISLAKLVAESDSAETPSSLRAAKQDLVANFERAYIEELLARHHGNVTRAAREAGKERRAFGRLIKKYNIHYAVFDARQQVGHS